MNYGELKTAVLEDSHRPGLASLIPRFIREGEGMIRREMTAFILTTTIVEAARQSNPAQYALPVGALFLRRIALQGQLGPGITRISLSAITSYLTTQRVAVYAEPGDGLVEFRGVPAENAVFDLNYFGSPAPLVDDSDTNSLLDDHESIYKSSAMFWLYKHTQDRELAGDEVDIFNGVVTTLNEQIARKIGGAKITASYQFGKGGGY